MPADVLPDPPALLPVLPPDTDGAAPPELPAALPGVPPWRVPVESPPGELVEPAGDDDGGAAEAICAPPPRCPAAEPDVPAAPPEY